MQLARKIPQIPTSLKRLGAPLASYAPSYRNNFMTSPGLRGNASPGTSGAKAGQAIRGLPEPDPEGQQKLDINSDEGLRLDHFGPVVLNKNGTISLITNWQKMTPVERENTLRVVGKRNQTRMEALKKEDKAETEAREKENKARMEEALENKQKKEAESSGGKDPDSLNVRSGADGSLLPGASEIPVGDTYDGESMGLWPVFTASSILIDSGHAVLFAGHFRRLCIGQPGERVSQIA